MFGNKMRKEIYEMSNFYSSPFLPLSAHGAALSALPRRRGGAACAHPHLLLAPGLEPAPLASLQGKFTVDRRT